MSPRIAPLERLRAGLLSSPNARRLLAVGLIDASGNGAFVSTAVVLFAAVLKLSPTEIGKGLAIGGLAGLLFSVPMGALADRFGVRRMLLIIQFWRAAGCAAFVFVDDFAGYLAIVAFLSVAEQASPPVLLAFVSSAMDEADRVKTAAALQSIRNAGFTIGALLGSLALISVGRTSLNIVVLGNAASFLIAAYLLAKVKGRVRAVRVRGERAAVRGAEQIRRRPAFLTATAVSGVLNIHPSLLEIALPLWIVTQALAPESLVSVLFAINTVMVVALQVRLARRSDTAAGSARILRRSGWTLLAFTVLMAVSAGDLPAAPWGAVVLLIAATAVLTFGEMWQAVGAWGLSLALSPESARGRFLAIFNLGPALRGIVGPLIVTAWVVSTGAVGWLVLGAVLALAGLVAPPVARWAQAELARHEAEDAAATPAETRAGSPAQARTEGAEAPAEA